MGIYINPAWEYYTPDPEAEYVVHWARAPAFDGLDQGGEGKAILDRFRVGRGDPNRGHFRLARRRPPCRTPWEAPLRACRGCGDLFRPKYRACAAQRFCSRECWRRSGEAPGAPRRLPPACCRGCGREFRRRRDGEGRFCRRHCYREWLAARRRPCEACGGPIRPKKGMSYGGKRPRTCSLACGYKIRRTPGGKGRARTLPDRTCRWAACGRTFRPPASKSKYCSRACRDDARRGPKT